MKKRELIFLLNLNLKKFETNGIFSVKKKNIKYFKFETLDQINKKIKFDYFIATISTAILEAPLYTMLFL